MLCQTHCGRAFTPKRVPSLPDSGLVLRLSAGVCCCATVQALLELFYFPPADVWLANPMTSEHLPNKNNPGLNDVAVDAKPTSIPAFAGGGRDLALQDSRSTVVDSNFLRVTRPAKKQSHVAAPRASDADINTSTRHRPVFWAIQIGWPVWPAWNRGTAPPI
jgi:hypothetical protein